MVRTSIINLTRKIVARSNIPIQVQIVKRPQTKEEHHCEIIGILISAMFGSYIGYKLTH